jgi:polysaccharide pyruvyl transferase WcaK-like protein
MSTLTRPDDRARPVAGRPGDGRALRIGLLWHSASSGNLGVGALTLANLAIVREVAREQGLDARFTIIGMRDGEVPSYVARDDADVFVVDRRSLLDPRGCWSVLGEQDLVLDIGAGDSFADIYGPKRFFFLWLTKMIAVARRRPLMLSPQTIGPFTRGPYRALARMALEAADTVVARDDASLRVLRELAPRAHGALSVDVAFALPYRDRSKERGGDRVRVGVNVSGLLFNEAEAGRNRFGLGFDYARLMRRFLDRMSRRDDVEVHLIPHVVSMTIPEDDDARVAGRLAAEFPGVIRVPRFDGPCEAKSYISSLDFLVAARMHACIAAVSSGVPVVPVAYSRKFSGLFGMLDYPWLVPVSGMDEETALLYLDDAFGQREALAGDAAQSMKRVAALLLTYKAELGKLMAVAAEVR